VDTELLHYGEVTVRGAFHATPLHFRKALKLIASRTIDVRPLITKKMKLEEINEAFQILSTAKSEIKIAIIP
jgi:L-iditol 2-dehydrogenase